MSRDPARAVTVPFRKLFGFGFSRGTRVALSPTRVFPSANRGASPLYQPTRSDNARFPENDVRIAD